MHIHWIHNIVLPPFIHLTFAMRVAMQYSLPWNSLQKNHGGFTFKNPLFLRNNPEKIWPFNWLVRFSSVASSYFLCHGFCPVFPAFLAVWLACPSLAWSLKAPLCHHYDHLPFPGLWDLTSLFLGLSSLSPFPSQPCCTKQCVREDYLPTSLCWRHVGFLGLL